MRLPDRRQRAKMGLREPIQKIWRGTAAGSKHMAAVCRVASLQGSTSPICARPGVPERGSDRTTCLGSASAERVTRSSIGSVPTRLVGNTKLTSGVWRQSLHATPDWEMRASLKLVHATAIVGDPASRSKQQAFDETAISPG